MVSIVTTCPVPDGGRTVVAAPVTEKVPLEFEKDGADPVMPPTSEDDAGEPVDRESDPVP